MEAILYFQKKRGLEAPEAEPVGMKHYLLVRVSLDVEDERWFGRDLHPPKRPHWEAEKDCEQEPEEKRSWFGHLLKRVREARARKAHYARQQEICEQRLEALRGYFRGWEEWQRRAEQTGEEIARLREEIGELTFGCEEVYGVYEEPVLRLLGPVDETEEKGGNPVLHSLWRQNFPVELFRGFGKEFWNPFLLPAVLPHHFVLQGTCGDIFLLLEHCAPSMKACGGCFLEQNAAVAFHSGWIGFMRSTGWWWKCSCLRVWENCSVRQLPAGRKCAFWIFPGRRIHRFWRWHRVAFGWTFTPWRKNSASWRSGTPASHIFP